MSSAGNMPLEPVTPLDKLLLGCVVFFAMVLVAISKWSPNDGQTFQVISGLVTGFAGAFLMRIKPAEKKLPANTEQTTVSTTVTPPVVDQLP
jgi:hypothetical protein